MHLSSKGPSKTITTHYITDLGAAKPLLLTRGIEYLRSGMTSHWFCWGLSSASRVTKEMDNGLASVEIPNSTFTGI